MGQCLGGGGARAIALPVTYVSTHGVVVVPNLGAGDWYYHCSANGDQIIGQQSVDPNQGYLYFWRNDTRAMDDDNLYFRRSDDPQYRRENPISCAFLFKVGLAVPDYGQSNPRQYRQRGAAPFTSPHFIGIYVQRNERSFVPALRALKAQGLGNVPVAVGNPGNLVFYRADAYDHWAHV